MKPVAYSKGTAKSVARSLRVYHGDHARTDERNQPRSDDWTAPPGRVLLQALCPE